MEALLVVILGLVVGSFLNAVIYRLHADISFMKGRSFCPWCKHDLHVWDLVPVFSYFLLRGKCRYCRKKISWQYPIVELCTALVFFLLWWQYGIEASLLVYMIYAAILMVIFVFDLKYYLILDKVTIPAMVVSFILSAVVLRIDVISLLLGALIGGGFFLLQFYISRGKWIGGGDIRLGAVMGLMVGFPHIIVALFIAYLFGSLIGIVLIARGAKQWKSQVPFGTFLAAATVITFFIGQRVIDYYQSLLI